MMMLGAVRRMFGAFSEDELFRRATRGDVGFFAKLTVPMVARAVTQGAHRCVVLTRTDRMADLDCDHAVILLTSPKPRVFGTELGVDIMSGAKTHFLVELDPYSSGLDGRLGNYGDLALPSDAEGIARVLVEATLRCAES